MKYIFLALSVAISYFIIFIYINNSNLINTTTTSSFPFVVKLQLFFYVITGIGSTMSLLNLITLSIISILTGCNFALLLYKISILQSSGTIKIIVGGSSLLGLISSGCASCGIPIFAFIGLGSSISIFPLKGYEFSLLTIFLLLLSMFILIKQIKQKNNCGLPKNEEK